MVKFEPFYSKSYGIPCEAMKPNRKFAFARALQLTTVSLQFLLSGRIYLTIISKKKKLQVNRPAKTWQSYRQT